MIRTEIRDLLKSIHRFNVAQDGDSGDEELEAACEMRDCALAVAQKVATRTIGPGEKLDLQEMLDEFEETQDEL